MNKENSMINELRNLQEQVRQVMDYSLLAAKNVLNIEDVATLTGLSKSHLYKLTCNRQIPFYKPNGKLMYFDREEIEAWMKQNRQTTQLEAEQQAAIYSITRGRQSHGRKEK